MYYLLADDDGTHVFTVSADRFAVIGHGNDGKLQRVAVLTPVATLEKERPEQFAERLKAVRAAAQEQASISPEAFKAQQDAHWKQMRAKGHVGKTWGELWALVQADKE